MVGRWRPVWWRSCAMPSTRMPEPIASVHEREDAEREQVEAALRKALGGEAA